MARIWGLYRRPDGQTVALPATDEDKAAYAAKGFAYTGPAPQPGMEATVPDAEIHAAALKALLTPPKK